MEFLLNLSNEVLYTVIGITGGAVCALHFVSVLTDGFISKCGQYVNIFLHIILFCTLLLAECRIEIAVAAFFASAFLYVLICYVKHTVTAKGRDDNELWEGDKR